VRAIGRRSGGLLEGSRARLLTVIREDLALAGLDRFGLASRELAQWLGLRARSITRIARRAMRRGSGGSSPG
jgi:hypothetical protein